MVDGIKELVSDVSKRVLLDDAVIAQLRRVTAALDPALFPSDQLPIDATTIGERLSRYVAAVGDLSTIVILLARWSEPSQFPTLRKVFSRLSDHDARRGGRYAWLSIEWYPVTLLSYYAGVAALSADRFDVLAEILTAPVGQPTGDPPETAIGRAITETADAAAHADAFKQLPGHERNLVPQSEYLFSEIRPLLEDLLLLGRSYEGLFDRFEVLNALTYAAGRGPERHTWGPLGRFAWKYRREPQGGPVGDLEREASAAGQDWPPVKAGLFGGSLALFQETTKRFREEALARWF